MRMEYALTPVVQEQQVMEQRVLALHLTGRQRRNSQSWETTVSGAEANQNSSKNTQTALVMKNADKPAVTISDTSYDNVAFNVSYYANSHTDLYQLYGDDAKALYDHFITIGITEGRQSSAAFSILVYKENNQDLQDAFGDDLIKYYNHFIQYGVNENRVAY